MAESRQSLPVRLAEWLSTQGYPLEMQVANAFHEHGFRVWQSEYYSDPETKTAREIDVVAMIDARAETYLLRVGFVVECKMALDKPWVLFTGTSPGLAAPARVVQRGTNATGKKLLHRLAQTPEIQALELFQLHGRPAHGLTQAFTSGPDSAYAAIHGVAKAAAALALDRHGGGVPI